MDQYVFVTNQIPASWRTLLVKVSGVFAIALFFCVSICAQSLSTSPSWSTRNTFSGLKVNIEHRMSLGLSVKKDGVSAPIASSVSAELVFGPKSQRTTLPSSDNRLKVSLSRIYLTDLTMMISEIEEIIGSCESSDSIIPSDDLQSQDVIQEEIESVRTHLKSELAVVLKETDTWKDLSASDYLPNSSSVAYSGAVWQHSLSDAACRECLRTRGLWLRGVRLNANWFSGSSPTALSMWSIKPGISFGASLSLTDTARSNSERLQLKPGALSEGQILIIAMNRMRMDNRVAFLRRRIDQIRGELRKEECSGNEHAKWLHEKYILYLVELYHIRRTVMERFFGYSTSP